MFFSSCATIEDLKKEYRRLCKIHHPDRGGDAATMAAINNEYDKVFRRLQSQKRTAQAATASAHQEQAEEAPEEYRAIIEKLLRIPDIEIEICGSWLWVTGATFPHREELKAAGMQYAKQKKAWYWHPAGYSRKSRRGYSMEEIRDMHGSEKVRTAKVERITA